MEIAGVAKPSAMAIKFRIGYLILFFYEDVEVVFFEGLGGGVAEVR